MKKTQTGFSLTNAEFAEMQTFAEAGKQYIQDLKADCQRLGKLIGEADMVTLAVTRLSTVDDLRVFRASLNKRWNEKLPPRMTASLPVDNPSTNKFSSEGQVLLEQLGVTEEEAAAYV